MAQSTIKTWIWRLVRVAVTAGVILWIARTVYWRDHARLPDGRELPVLQRTDSGAVLDERGRETCLDLLLRPARRLFGADLAPREKTYRNSQLATLNGEPLIKLGLRTVAGNIRWLPLAIALIGFGGVPLFAGLRWRRLLCVQQVHLSVGTALKLTWIGLFFNQFMIGTVGGDLIKAYYVTKHTDTAKAESVLTILIDRIIGMLGLLWLSGVGILIWLAARPGGPPLPQRLPWAWVIGIIGFMVLAAVICFNDTLRRRLGVAALMARLPERHMARRLDRAVQLYWHHKRVVLEAFGWTFLSHVCLLGATFLVARSLDMYSGLPGAAGLLHTVTVATVIFVGAGLIPSLAGLGPLEGGFVLFFSAPGIGAQAQSLMLALSYRVEILLWSMPGAAFLAVGAHLPSRAEMKKEMDEAAT